MLQLGRGRSLARNRHRPSTTEMRFMAIVEVRREMGL